MGWVMNGDWEVGTYSTTPPGSAATYKCVGGVNLAGDYTDNAGVIRLSAISPPLALSDCSGLSGGYGVVLHWNMSFTTETGDNLYLQISNNGGTSWMETQLSAGGWTALSANITSYANTDDVLIRFMFELDGSVGARGPYIDNIWLEYTNSLPSTTWSTPVGDNDDTDPPSGGGCGSGGTILIDAIVRDFSASHDDFEISPTPAEGWNCQNITEDQLQNIGDAWVPELDLDTSPGPDNCFDQCTSTTANFNEWYITDTVSPYVNYEFVVPLTFEDNVTNAGTGQTANDGMYTYLNDAFFPLTTSQGFGDEGYDDTWGAGGTLHNYHFTTEIRLWFRLVAGQTFTFTGDDDVWVFIDEESSDADAANHRVIDLGGIHGALSQSFSTNDLLAIGAPYFYEDHYYRLNVFHAERHVVASNFRIDTNLCLQDVE
jgi:fibro-slime domain-containing protein